METVKNKTYAVVGKQLVKVTSQDQSINFKTQQVRLKIFVDDREFPKYTHLCSTLVDKNQADPTIVEFPTHGENMFINAYSEDKSVDLNKLLITGF
jgi:hypothetical protein